MSTANASTSLNDNKKDKPPRGGYGAAAAPAPRIRSAPFEVTRAAPRRLLLNPLVWLLWLLDFVAWLVLALLWPPWLWKWLRTCCLPPPAQSVAHPGGFRTLLRNKADGSVDLKTLPFGPNETTMHALLQHSCAAYGHLPCLGTRTYVGMHTPAGAKFPLKVFGETTWKSYADLERAARCFGAGLRSAELCGDAEGGDRFGLAPLPAAANAAALRAGAPLNGPHSIVIFEETCADWTIACLGAMGQSIVVATSYATLGMGAVAEAVNQCGAPVIVCNYKDVKRVAATCDAACPALKTIIYTRNYVEAGEPALPERAGRLRVLSLNEVVLLGAAAPLPFAAPTPDHLALIMYTSGSTGKPKGVMQTHRAIVASVAGLEGFLCGISKRATSAADQETYLAYLPAAHILEFCAEMAMLVHGAKLGYADPKTISSAGAIRKLPDGTLNGIPTGFGKMPPGGIQEFGPTLMAAVPKIWDILKKGVEDGVGKQSALVQLLFQAAFSARSAALRQGRESPLLGLLFKKVGRLLGGRIKLAITGGGPISADIHNFVRVAMHFPLIQGYGLTETSSCGTLQPYRSIADGVAGAPVQCVQLKLADCDKKEIDGTYSFLDRAKKPYLASDTQHLGSPCLGRGEVWIKGAPVSSGYYCKPEETAKEFDADGYFHTGDIAIWTPDGMLKIVDRLKNLVKLKGGEYVALESMEATYAQSVYVNGRNGGIMCYADGDMDKPIALLQVNDYELKKWAAGAGVAFKSVEELCANPKAVEMVTGALNAIGKSTLGANELLASVALLPGTAAPESAGADAPWTSENGYLTAANKLARNTIKEGFAATIAAVKPAAIR